ncbi:MAG: YebC/PmpR family DNA-binding transcriptional regulator [Dissulfurimicrobium sp.]|uniref:YebC/PmpR family DNA-binding transcriptional regulator n=1 Tax=Dissulfurimicrobium sp. TaxID=2022436 RepID=UPI00404B5375
MSGHSKWSTIKHKKSALDAKRGKIFTKLIKEIMVAVRLGGSDATSNPRLRSAIMAAKAENMPKNNIERAIKRGAGELDGVVNYEEILYEGYGPGGVAVLVEAMTDNRQRTVSDVRHIFSKHGGSLGEPGSVAWMFEKKGLIVINKNKSETDEEALMTLALEAGAEDLKDEESRWEIYTTLDAFENVRAAIEAGGINIEEAQVTMIPKTTVKIEDEQQAGQILRLMEAMEDNDDVQHVYANFDISDSLLEKLG